MTKINKILDYFTMKNFECLLQGLLLLTNMSLIITLKVDASFHPIKMIEMVGNVEEIDSFGESIGTGDVNKDGYTDLIMGAPNKNFNTGGVYVIYGGPTTSLSDLDLATTVLDPLTTGFMIKRNVADEYFGGSVSTAGDIDKDGYDDIIIGSRYGPVACVIYGRPKASTTNIDISTTALDPLTTGFMIKGNAAGDPFGWAVSRAGDINKDGYADVIIGAVEKNSYRGAAYVIYGGPKSSMSNIDLSAPLNPLTTGFKITGNAAGDNFGWPVSSVGDINKDGYSDVIIGAADKNSYRGAAYVLYGGAKSSMSNIDLSTTTLDPLTTGFMITGKAAYDGLGSSVSCAGDVNNDGYDDVIVGASGGGGSKGAAYVIYGGPKSSMPNIDLSSTSLNPQTNGWMITGSAAMEALGTSVSSAGDINKDGYDDVIVGAMGTGSLKGAAHVIYGGPKSSSSNIDLSVKALDLSTTGFSIFGTATMDSIGRSVSAADVNNDGNSDLIVGGIGSSYTGRIYLFLSKEFWF